MNISTYNIQLLINKVPTPKHYMKIAQVSSPGSLTSYVSELHVALSAAKERLKTYLKQKQIVEEGGVGMEIL